MCCVYNHFGGYCLLDLLHFNTPFSLKILFISVGIFALLRGILRYAEQACNHFIAFKLLALIRDKVFQSLRRLCPAKLEGRDKGDLISIITSDIELLEVFYAHTISPAAIAFLFTIVRKYVSVYWSLPLDFRCFGIACIFDSWIDNSHCYIKIKCR